MYQLGMNVRQIQGNIIDQKLMQYLYKHESIIVEQMIGYGLTSVVYRCAYVNNNNKIDQKTNNINTVVSQNTTQMNKKCALKLFSLNINESNRLKLKYQLQCQILYMFKQQNDRIVKQNNNAQNNNNIVQILTNREYGDSHAYIIMQYIQKGNIYDFNTSINKIRNNMHMLMQPCFTCKLNQQKQINITQSISAMETYCSVCKQNKIAYIKIKKQINDKVRYVMIQLLQLLIKLQEYKIIHKDIKLQNLMIGSNGMLKLIDFGSLQIDYNLSQTQHQINNNRWVNTNKINKIINNHDYLSGSKHYISPELISGKRNRYISTRIDIWAFGVIFYKLICGTFPFSCEKQSNFQFYSKIRQQQPIYNTKQIQKQQLQIIKQCLMKNPKKRPSAKQLKSKFAYFNKQQISQATISNFDDLGSYQILLILDGNVRYRQQHINTCNIQLIEHSDQQDKQFNSHTTQKNRQKFKDASIKLIINFNNEKAIKIVSNTSIKMIYAQLKINNINIKRVNDNSLQLTQSINQKQKQTINSIKLEKQNMIHLVQFENQTKLQQFIKLIQY